MRRLLGFVSTSILFPTLAFAQTYHAVPGSDVFAVDGVCTLREAVECYNGAPGPSSCVADCGPAGGTNIALDGGQVYVLSNQAATDGASEDNNLTGDLDLAPNGLRPLTITNNGPSGTAAALATIQMSGAATSKDRLFDVRSANISSLTLLNLMLQNGDVSAVAEAGGCVRIVAGLGSGGAGGVGGVLLNSVTIESCTAGTTGGAIDVNPNSGFTGVQMSNCAVTSNQAPNGGGGLALSTSASLLLDNTQVTLNAASGDGGGVFFPAGNPNGTLVTTNGSSIAQNSSTANGGGLYFAAGSATLSATQLDSNRASVDGGGIYAAGGSLTGTASAVTHSTATRDGGGIFMLTGNVTWQSGLGGTGHIDHNTAGRDGGALFMRGATTPVSGSALTLDSITVSNNSATTGDGGAIYHYAQQAMTIGNTTLQGNSASAGFGGALYAVMPTGCAPPAQGTTISDSTIGGSTASSGNTALVGGAIFAAGCAGGGIVPPDTHITVQGSTLSFNQSTATLGGGSNAGGGGIASTNTDPGPTTTGYGISLISHTGVPTTLSNNTTLASNADGGAVAMVKGRVNINGANFQNNNCTGNGGALFFSDTTTILTTPTGATSSPAVIAGAHFDSNLASNNGGAIYVTGRAGGVRTLPDVAIDTASFSNNSAGLGGALYVDGSANPAVVTLTNATFDANSAATSGGAIYNLGLITGAVAPAPGMQNVTLTNNIAGTSGGGIEQDNTTASDTLSIANSVWLGNTSANGPDCATAPSGEVTSRGSNMQASAAPPGCNYTTAANELTTTLAVNQLLQSLQASPDRQVGSAVLTRAPLFFAAGNPLVNAGGVGVPCAGIDARSVARPQGAACDIGAYETELDLQVIKAPTGAVVHAGANAAYTLTLLNAGGIDIANPAFSDTLPSNLLFSAIVAPTGWSCVTPSAGQNGAISCSAASLPHTGPTSAAFNVTVTVDPATAPGSTIADHALGTSALADFALGNNDGLDALTIDGAITWGLTLVRTPSGSPIGKGVAVSYVVTIANSGPSTATDGLLADLLDPRILGASIGCVAAAGSSCGPGSNQFSVGPASSVTLTISGYIDPAASTATTVGFSASVAASGYTAGGPSGIVDPAPFTIDSAAAVASLSAQVTAQPSTVFAGNVATFLALRGNGGPSVSTNVSSTFTLGDSGETVASLTLDPTCLADKSVGQAGPVTVTCACNGSCFVSAHAPSGIATVGLLIPSSAAAGASVSGTLGVSGDFSPQANATGQVTVATQADVAVSAVLAPAQVNPGDATTLTIDATNAGPSDSGTITVTATLPADVTATLPAQCTQSGSTVTCTGSVAASGDTSFALTLAVDANATLGDETITVTSSGGASDPSTANNTTTVTLTIGQGSGVGSTATGDTGGMATNAGNTVAHGCHCRNGQTPSVDLCMLAAALVLGIRLTRRVRMQKR